MPCTFLTFCVPDKMPDFVLLIEVIQDMTLDVTHDDIRMQWQC